MIYDLSNPLHRESFKVRCNTLYERGKIVDLTEKKFGRTTSQNRYLHLILGYFAIQYGETLDWVKEKYFKQHVNASIFVKEKHDPFIGKAILLRSTSTLTTAEMTEAIERFRDWSSKEAGIYLPSPQDEKLLELIEIENERYKRYL